MPLAREKFLLPIEEAKVRYDICKACENFIPITSQCRECGCWMKAKVRLRSNSCPLGKWHAIPFDKY